MIKKLIEAHKFFVEKSPEYVGSDIEYDYYNYGQPYHTGVYKMKMRDKLYYPIAYIKFMWSTLND